MKSSSNNYDIFDVTFDILIDSLIIDKTNKRNNIDDKLSEIVWHELKLKTVSQYETVKQARFSTVENFNQLLHLKRMIYNQITQGTQLNIELCDRLMLMVEKRLFSQQVSADNRLKELVFEIIGEYGKSHIRGKIKLLTYLYND